MTTDNFLITFKKDLWDKCLEQNIFDGIPETEINAVKAIFETNISNYKTQIFQDNNNSLLTTTLLNSIKKDSDRLKSVTRQQINDVKKGKFNNELKIKQDEYDSLVKKNIPQTPDFSDGVRDEPLDSENLESLIQQQMKDRELSTNQTTQSSPELNEIKSVSDTNHVVMTNQFTHSSISPDAGGDYKLISDSINVLVDENRRLNQQFLRLEQITRAQNIILDQIAGSQIIILKKIK